MGAPDISNWIWPDADLNRQPQGVAVVNPTAFQAQRCFLGGRDALGVINVGLPFLRTPAGLGFAGSSGGGTGNSVGTSKLTTSNGSGTGDFSILFVTDAATSTTPSVIYASETGSFGTGAWIAFNANAGGSGVSGGLAWGTWAGAHTLSLTGMLDGKAHGFLINSRAGVITIYRDGVSAGSVTGVDAVYASGANEWLGGPSYTGFSQLTTQSVQLLATSNQGLTDGQARALTLNPWSIFKPQTLGLFVPSSGGSTVTGTGASTQAPNVSAASGGVTVSGTATSTQQGNTSAASGSIVVSGTSSSVQQVNASSASGAIKASGTGASTQAGNVSTASASVTVSGVAASTQSANVSTASGSAAISGTSASTQAANVSSASASVTVSGSGASNQGANVSSAAGAVKVSGAGASTQQPNASAAAGSLLVSGSAASTQAPNVSSAGGDIGNVVAGTGASTQNPNTSTASGSLSVSGSAASQNANVSAATGVALVSGSSASAQQKNTGAVTGSAVVTATGTSTQGLNVSSASGTVSNPTVSGSGASTQAANVSSAVGLVKASGSASSSQQPNYSVATGIVGGVAYPIEPAYYVRFAPRPYYIKVAARACYASMAPRSFYVKISAMLNVIPSLNVLDPRESAVLTFDATALLNGATMTGTPVVSMTTTSGTDSPPSLTLTNVIINSQPITVNGVTIAAGNAVQAVAQGGAFGNTYLIAIKVQTTNPDMVWVLKAYQVMAAQ